MLPGMFGLSKAENSQRGHSPLCIPHGGEVSPAGSVGVGKAPPALNASPAPPPTRRGFGLGCRLGRSWTVPTGHQDPSRQARRCHRKAMTEGVMPGRSSGGDKIPAGGAQRNFPVPRGHAPHPLPPPVRKVGGGEWLVGTGGGRLFYTSHFKGGADAPPLEPPLQQAWTKRALGGKGSWCPVGTAQDRPRRQPRPKPPEKTLFLCKKNPPPMPEW